MTGIQESRAVPNLSEVELRVVAVNTRGVTLGEDIKTARERLRMNQLELAEAVGVSESTVSNWERGRSNPKNRLGLVRQILKMDDAGERTQREGRLLKDASMPELLMRIMELHDEVAQRAAVGPTYKPGAPDPEDDGLIAGPTERTDRANRARGGAQNQA